MKMLHIKPIYRSFSFWNQRSDIASSVISIYFYIIYIIYIFLFLPHEWHRVIAALSSV